MNESQEQTNNNSRPWLFQKGKSGNPGGRPKGSKSLKTRAREYLEGLTDEEALEFFEGLNKLDVWKMAEGNPHSTEDTKVEVTLPTPLLNGLYNNHGNKEDSETPKEN